jgi:UDP-GlcNAc:undecaprenyl-phosphate GlcNAc-1-phosphate transferase
MTWIVVLAIAVPFVISTVLTVIVRRWARRAFVDAPGGHKAHEVPTPLGGGIAITWTLCGNLVGGTLAVWLAQRFNWSSNLPEMIRVHTDGIVEKLPDVFAVASGAIVLHILGLIDDRRPLGPGIKFLVQFAVAFALVWGFEIRANEWLGPAGSIALTVLWIVLVVNAFNFLDNMDGLSAGVGAIACAILAAAAFRNGQMFVPVAALLLAGTLLGFLVFNFSPASIFMGDSGSMVVGYFLAVLTVLTTFYDPDRALTPYGVLVPLVVLSVPLYDVFSVCWARIRAGASPFRGDQRHFSHRLRQRGMSVRAAVLTIYLATAATSLPALLLPRAQRIEACILIAQTACVVLIVAVLEQTPRRNREMQQ